MSFLSSAVAFYNDFINFLISQGRDEDALEVAEISRARTLAGRSGSWFLCIVLPHQEFSAEANRSSIKSCGAFLLAFPRRATFLSLGRRAQSGKASYLAVRRMRSMPSSRAIRRALLGPRDVLETGNPAGKKLYDLLVAPAQTLVMPCKGSHVTILSDGSLYNLNFETLLAPSPQLHYWIDDAVISERKFL